MVDRTQQEELASSQAAKRGQIVTAEEYAKFRPLLLIALSRLARQGYSIPPVDGLELIHDFFIEAWAGLVDRYDESRAKFETYMFAAFVKFARPRIIKTVRWTRELLPPDELAKVQDSHHIPPEDGEEAFDLQALELQVESLTPMEQQLLRARFAERLSERAIARQMEMSRYHLREVSAGALTKLAARLGEPGVIGADDWNVASTLWVEDRSISETARRLTIPVARVRSARERVIRQIVANVSKVLEGKSSQRRTSIMEHRQEELSSCEIWVRLVKNPHDADLLKLVRKTPETLNEFLSHIEDCETCEKVGSRIEDVEGIYSALGAPEGDLAGEDLELLNRSLEARANDERELEEAVLTVLMPSLEAKLQSVIPWLASDVLPMVPESWPDVLSIAMSSKHDDSGLSALRPDLREDFFLRSWLPVMPKVETSLSPLEIKFVETPVNSRRLDFAILRRSARTAFLAMNAVAMVVESSLRRTQLPWAYLGRNGLFVGKDPVGGKLQIPAAPNVPHQVIVNEISGVAVVPIEAAEKLCGWIFLAAREHPHLFLGLDSKPIDYGVGLSLAAERTHDLNRRWAMRKVKENPPIVDISNSGALNA